MKTTQIILICLLITTLSFLGGISVGVFKYFPYEYVNVVYDQLNKNTLEHDKTNNQLNNKINVTTLIHIHTYSDIGEKRSDLIKYIWKQNKLHEENNPVVEESITDSKYTNLKNLSRIDRITVNMDYNVNSVAYLFLSNVSNGNLVIYHQGHDGDFELGKDTIQYFLERNYSVLAFSMPLLGMNNQPIVELPNFGKLKLATHDDLKFLESESFSPIKFFVEPILVSLNYVDKKFDFGSYHMVGISGGGWTTVIYSAIDTRVTKSYPVAGSLPLYLRFENPKDMGDYEQTLPSLYNITNYLDLYVLGSHGEGRGQLQIFNEYDPCCFSGTGYQTYEDEIKNTLKDLGSGKFSVFLESRNKKHSISDDSLDVIIKDMETN